MDFLQPDVPAMGAVFPSRNEPTCMVYHENGKRLYVASEADSKLQVIDCMQGKLTGPALRCERERLHLVEPTHHEDCLLFAGGGAQQQQQPSGGGQQQQAVCYWSLYDNKILRKFRGHSDVVTSIAMSPADDRFLSSSRDRTVRLWTLQSAGCLGEMKLPATDHGGSSTIKAPPLAVFDSTGLVFGVTAPMADGTGQHVHLYDARNFVGGAFAEMKVSYADVLKTYQAHHGHMGGGGDAHQISHSTWTSMQFNLSGSQLLVGTDTGSAILLDGFEGSVQRVWSCASSSSSKLPATKNGCVITPDDKTLLLGNNEDGSIHCYNVETGALVKKLTGHAGAVRCVAANPKYSQLASSCTQTALWIW